MAGRYKKDMCLLDRPEIHFKMSFNMMKQVLYDYRQFQASSLQGQICQILLESFRRWVAKLQREKRMPPKWQKVFNDAMQFYDEQEKIAKHDKDLMQFLDENPDLSLRELQELESQISSDEFREKIGY